MRTVRRKRAVTPRKKVGHLRPRGRVGGGHAEHERAQHNLADPLWRKMQSHLSELPTLTQEKIKDYLYRGAWDWISDH